jgi:hypothetical protein
MALTSGPFETCARALGTCMPSCIGRPARLLFMLEARGPPWIAGRVAAQSPPSREARFRAVGHMAVPEPTSARRRGLEP